MLRAQVVVITGASAGVGRATARAFAERGARLGLLARGIEGLEATHREVLQLGGEAVVVPTDVADPEQVEAAAELIERHYGPIDIWINNAMTSIFGPAAEASAAELRRVTEVTYLGTVYGTLAALRRMLPRNRGTIVQVGSALAYRGIPLQAAYCGAKHAIQGFTESVRCELMHDGSAVHMTMVQLPALNTPQFGWVKTRLPNKAQPVPPIHQPEVAARAIVWASQQRRREVFVGMSTVKAIWGNKLAPWLGDWYLAKTGYKAQQTSEPEQIGRAHNLWQPIPEDRGAHGAFDARASSKSLQLWLTMHRTAIAALALAIVAGLVALAPIMTAF